MKRPTTKPTYAHLPIATNPPCITCGWFKPHARGFGGKCSKLFEMLSRGTRYSDLGDAASDKPGCKYWKGRQI